MISNCVHLSYTDFDLGDEEDKSESEDMEDDDEVVSRVCSLEGS